MLGSYRLEEEKSFAALLTEIEKSDAERRSALETLLEFSARRFQDFSVQASRIRSGRGLVQEFCFVEVYRATEDVLEACAVWHEDVHDPGDASLIGLSFEKVGGEFHFTLHGADDAGHTDDPIVLRKRVPGVDEM